MQSEGFLCLASGAPGEIRTHNPWVRSPVLYPLSYGRMLGMNRVKLMVGRATGFEPVISCATDRRLRPLGYARRDEVLILRLGWKYPRDTANRTQFQVGSNMLANERGSYKEYQRLATGSKR